MRDLIRSIQDKQTEQALYGLLSLNNDNETKQFPDGLDANGVNINRQEINQLSVAALQLLLKQRAECGPNYPRQRHMPTPPRHDSPKDYSPANHSPRNDLDNDQPLDLSDESNTSITINPDQQLSAMRSTLPLNLITTASRAQLMGSMLNMQSQLPFQLPHSPLAVKTEDSHVEDRRSPYLAMYDPSIIASSHSSTSLTQQSIVAQQLAAQQLAAARHLAAQQHFAHSLNNLVQPVTLPTTTTSATGSESGNEDEDPNNKSKSVIVQHTSLDLRKVIKEEESIKHSRSPIKKRPYVPSKCSETDTEGGESVYKHSRLSTDSMSSTSSYGSYSRPASVPGHALSPGSGPPGLVNTASNQILSDYHTAQALRVTATMNGSVIPENERRPLSPESEYRYRSAAQDYRRVTSPDMKYSREGKQPSLSDHHTAIVAPIIQNRYSLLSREEGARLTVPLLISKINESFYSTFTFLKPRLEEMHFKLRNYRGSESMDGMINRLISEHMDKSNSFQVSKKSLLLS